MAVENHKDGKWTDYYKNGRIKKDGNYKDGKKDGKWTGWNAIIKSGYEETYKDGEEISSKCWDEDGNDCECSKGLWKGCK